MAKKKKTRLEDIALACGVTKGLVSRALAGKHNVGDETRNIIMQKAVELDYDFSKLRAKTKKKTSVVVVVAHEILMKEDFWQPILKNAYAMLNRSSIKLEYFVFDSQNLDLESVRALKDNPCLAFIIIHKNPDSLFRELKKFNKPIIEVDPKYMHYTGSTQIKYSNYISIYEATQKLIDYGHKNILFFGSDGHSMSFRERHEGFMSCIDANANNGIKGKSLIFDNSNLQYCDNELLIKTLKENKDITAIVCANDIVALNAYRIINELGKKVPDDYSVIGFDDIRAGRYSDPPLATFHVPREQIGDEIGLYIIRLTQENKPQYSEFIIRCNFMERGSIKDIK